MGLTKQAAIARIREAGLIPIVRTSSSGHALVAAEAIDEAGIGIAEITMTVPNALRVLEELAERFGSRVLLGAGTVLDAEKAEAAIAAGAEFIVSPCLEPAVMEAAARHGKPAMPGALTPTEVVAAWRSGADFIKIFPCGPVGGPRYIKALRGPFPDLPLVPTGGVSRETAPQFIEAGAVAVAAGSELIDPRALAAGDTATIASTARKYLEAIQAARARMAAPSR